MNSVLKRIRLPHVIVLIVLIVAILLLQLMLSIWLAHGAYQLSSLQNEQQQVGRQAQTLRENIAAQQSPQHLSAAATKLGMVPNGPTQFLDVSTGKLVGTATAGGSHVTDKSNLISNSVLDATTGDAADNALQADGTGENTVQKADSSASSTAAGKTSLTLKADQSSGVAHALPQAQLR